MASGRRRPTLRSGLLLPGSHPGQKPPPALTSPPSQALLHPLRVSLLDRHVSYFWAALRIRNIAEHALTERSDNPLRHARTTKTNWITRTVLSPYWVNYHVEHHAYMYVPCYNLPKLHQIFRDNGYLEKMEYKKSYRDVLKSAITPA